MAGDAAGGVGGGRSAPRRGGAARPYRDEVVRSAAIALAALLITMATPCAAQNRVDPTARQILDYRLTLDNVRRVDSVMRAMDRVPDRGPEAPRADVAMMTVLAMGWAYNEPWRDSTMLDAVRTTEQGHIDLAQAIRGAGLATRDYVLTLMNLMLAHPVVAARRQGRTVATRDVSGENISWVDANWAEADRLMREFGQRIASARGR
jgi:hypothetical protein